MKRNLFHHIHKGKWIRTPISSRISMTQRVQWTFNERSSYSRVRPMILRSVSGVAETLHMMFGRPSIIIHSLLQKVKKKSSSKSRRFEFVDQIRYLCKKFQCNNSICWTAGRPETPIADAIDYWQIANANAIEPCQLQIQETWIWRWWEISCSNFKLAQIAIEVINPSSLKTSDEKDRKNKSHQAETNLTN